MKYSLLILNMLFSLSAAIGQETAQTKMREVFMTRCSEPMDIDTARIDFKDGAVYFYVDTESVEGDDFSAYFINATDSIFFAERQEGGLMMIQEALDEAGKWRPIECWMYSFCGNSYLHPLILPAGKYVTVSVRKYTGSFKTKLRLKVKVEFKHKASILYSEPFDGSINPTQLEQAAHTSPENYFEEP